MRADDPHELTLRCPRCRARMETGFVPTGGGMHWFRSLGGSEVDFAEGLAGTASIYRSNRLPAWRCRRCRLVLFQHGREMPRRLSQLEEARAEPGDETGPEAPDPG